MLLKTFIGEEKYKLLASLFASSFFLYFWINGPIQLSNEILYLEPRGGRFSIPRLITSNENKSIRSFNTIDSELDTGGEGYGLILDKKKVRPSFGSIIKEDSNLDLSEELAGKILTHSKKILLDTQSLVLNSTSEMHYVLAKGKSGKPQIYLESEGVIQNIRGYAGAINIGLVLDEDGRIVTVRHISSKETASYLRKIQRAAFYQQFENRKISLGVQQVDAVSGATITCEAIAKTLTSLVTKATPSPLSDYVETGNVQVFSVEAVLSNIWIIHILLIFSLFFYGLQKKWKKSKKRVLILQILSVVYIGFFLNNSFTYTSFIHPFIGTTVSSLTGLYAFFCLLGAIWGRNTYCKYVCPFGNIQRLLLRISPLKTARFFISSKWIYRVRGGLALILITGVLLGLRNWSSFELFPDLFGLDWKSAWFFTAIVSVLVSIRYPMIWCRLLCPTGAVLDGVSDLMKKA